MLQKARFAKIGLVPGEDFARCRRGVELVPSPNGQVHPDVAEPNENDPSIIDGSWTIPAVKKNNGNCGLVDLYVCFCTKRTFRD